MGIGTTPQGFARALTEFDAMLQELLRCLRPTDLLILTADHGNDPTTPSTDHSREYLPLLLYAPSIERGRDVGVRRTLADVGATLGALWGVQLPNGEPIRL
jgi:phosphopentomutase